MSRSWFRSILFSFCLLAVGQRAFGADAPPLAADKASTAIFAGGCFWCTESDFEKVPGVIGAQSGYTGGKKANPTYEEVSAGGTGHAEAVRVTYDPARVSYAQLVEYFWRTIDPTVKNRQFCDIGSQYRSAIFWRTEEERTIAEKSRDTLLASGRFKEINTEIVQATEFYPAEEYHQDYYKKNPLRYGYYRHGCGRDDRLRTLWGTK
ncbi:MAG: peptide-methionine (S)-S-oxide reductase MsrA [Propionivibrio sp.]